MPVILKNKVLIYGANGYTGKLAARFACQYDIVPVVAGRNKVLIEQLAKELNLPFRVFDLNDNAAIEAALQDIAVVIHAAGPFDATAVPMVEACLNTGTHYLDLNGDKDVFEILLDYDSKAKSKQLMIMPGAGFDVVPTDCLAMHLKSLLPDATHLQIAFATPGGAISHGTAITTIKKLGEPGAIRENGKLTPVPIGHKSMWVNFFAGKTEPEKKLFVMSIPWGDIFTAYISTGIPNIETYTAVQPFAYLVVKMQWMFNWLLRKQFVRNFLKKKIHQRSPGLNDEDRNKAKSLVWGKATNASGVSKTARLCAADAYTLTAHSCLIIAKRILNGNFKVGYQTPSGAYGADLVLEIPDVVRE